MHRHQLLLYLIPLLSAVTARLTNVTVDDSFGDLTTGAQVTYSPDIWNAGQYCSGCTAKVDATKTMLGSWHDGTFYPTGSTLGDPGTPISLSVQFNGSAIYVYGILTFTETSPDGNTDMQFYIDNDNVGSLTIPPNGTATYVYDYPLYVNESIPAGQHTFMLESGGSNVNKSLVLFDYLKYTTDDGKNDPSGSSSLSGTSTMSVNTGSSSGTLSSSTSSSTQSSASNFGIKELRLSIWISLVLSSLILMIMLFAHVY